MSQATDADVRDEIETNVDALGLAHFLSLIADVCNDKHEHVLIEWQDKKLADEWEKARQLLVSVVGKVNV